MIEILLKSQFAKIILAPAETPELKVSEEPGFHLHEEKIRTPVELILLTTTLEEKWQNSKTDVLEETFIVKLQAKCKATH